MKTDMIASSVSLIHYEEECHLLYLVKHNNISIDLNVSYMSYLAPIWPAFLAPLLNQWALFDVEFLEPPLGRPPSGKLSISGQLPMSSVSSEETSYRLGGKH